MKNTAHRNLAIALFLSLFVITACSKTDSATTTILPKTSKSTSISSGTTTTTTSTITYNGNKIVSVDYDASSEVSKVAYTYTGDLITKQVVSLKSGVTGTEDYTYNTNNKLIKKVSTWSSNDTGDSESNYAYNSDGTVTETYYNIVKATGVKTLSSTTVYTFSGGNCVKSASTSSGSSSTTTKTYEYDTKNSPFKNITGLLATRIDGSVNNVTKEVTTYSSSSFSPSTTTHTYTYDANGYPTKIIYSSTSSEEITY